MEQKIKHLPGDTFIETVNGQFVSQYINSCGIKIRQRCSTCKFGQIKAGKGSEALLVQCKVSENRDTKKCSDLCRAWEPNKTVINAGKGDGKIKSPEYLIWLSKNIDNLLQKYEYTFPEVDDRMKVSFLSFVHNTFEKTIGNSIYLQEG